VKSFDTKFRGLKKVQRWSVCVCLIFSHMSSSQEIKRAFKFWTDAADLRIDETNGTPDIAISFERGDHVDGSPFDDTGIFIYYELWKLLRKSQLVILDKDK
jgi:hypothetical protein